jgi:predicted nucleotidyltransferase
LLLLCIQNERDVKRLHLDPLPGILTRYLDIQEVYLFGSAAEAKEQPDSDIDLAIVPRSRELRKRRLDIMADLARAGFGRVDLLFLDVDDIVVKFEAVRQNRIIYQAEDLERGAFYSRIVRQNWDFLPYLAIQRRAFKRRLLDGQS